MYVWYTHNGLLLPSTRDLDCYGFRHYLAMLVGCSLFLTLSFYFSEYTTAVYSDNSTDENISKYPRRKTIINYCSSGTNNIIMQQTIAYYIICGPCGHVCARSGYRVLKCVQMVKSKPTKFDQKKIVRAQWTDDYRNRSEGK